VTSRIALRIYVLGVLQFLVVLGAMEATRILSVHRPPPFGERQARYVVEDLARVWDDRPALEREVDRIARTLDWTVSVRDASGAVLAHVDPPPAEGHPRYSPFTRMTVPIPLSGGRAGVLEYDMHPAAPPPGMSYPFVLVLVLLVVGVTTFLTARSVTQPLAAITDATRAFGRGELEARTRLRRKDEIGAVADAFDDMADRVVRLLLSEREMLANVSHELRTPLARIRVAVDLASEAEPQVAIQSFKDIAEDLAELERIVNDVLTAARLAHQRADPRSPALKLQREHVDLRALLDKAATRFAAYHPARTLRVELADDLPTIHADPVFLRRVVDNLLHNAEKYSRASGAPIHLSARREGNDVVVEVRDRGVGMSEEDRARVFEPFYRADRSRSRSTGGIGLGLALAKGVVEAHGGTIAFESTLGKGTVARVRLPTS
jgi:signal transduction histidine kinase